MGVLCLFARVNCCPTVIGAEISAQNVQGQRVWNKLGLALRMALDVEYEIQVRLEKTWKITGRSPNRLYGTSRGRAEPLQLVINVPVLVFHLYLLITMWDNVRSVEMQREMNDSIKLIVSEGEGGWGMLRMQPPLGWGCFRKETPVGQRCTEQYYTVHYLPLTFFYVILCPCFLKIGVGYLLFQWNSYALAVK